MATEWTPVVQFNDTRRDRVASLFVEPNASRIRGSDRPPVDVVCTIIQERDFNKTDEDNMRAWGLDMDSPEVKRMLIQRSKCVERNIHHSIRAIIEKRVRSIMYGKL